MRGLHRLRCSSQQQPATAGAQGPKQGHEASMALGANPRAPAPLTIVLREGLLSWNRSPPSSTKSALLSAAIWNTSSNEMNESSLRTSSFSHTPCGADGEQRGRRRTAGRRPSCGAGKGAGLPATDASNPDTPRAPSGCRWRPGCAECRPCRPQDAKVGPRKRQRRRRAGTSSEVQAGCWQHLSRAPQPRPCTPWRRRAPGASLGVPDHTWASRGGQTHSSAICMFSAPAGSGAAAAWRPLGPAWRGSASHRGLQGLRRAS